MHKECHSLSRCGLCGHRFTIIHSRAELDVADPTFLPRVRTLFASSGASDGDIKDTIETFEATQHYRLCPHTAAGVFGAITVDAGAFADVPVIAMATAHPDKFGDRIEGSKVVDGVMLQPTTPDCLQGLLDKPKRCESLPNDVAAVAAFIEKC